MVLLLCSHLTSRFSFLKICLVAMLPSVIWSIWWRCWKMRQMTACRDTLGIPVYVGDELAFCVSCHRRRTQKPQRLAVSLMFWVAPSQTFGRGLLPRVSVYFLSRCPISVLLTSASFWYFFSSAHVKVFMLCFLIAMFFSSFFYRAFKRWNCAVQQYTSEKEKK